MKKSIIPFLTVFFVLCAASWSLAAETSNLDLKVGQELYVCNCGKGCDCDTMSLKKGKCTCGKAMVKGTVLKLEDGKALIKTAKEERLFKTVGVYACACGKGCDCNTISQKAGKCTCGKPMKLVKAKK